MEPLKALGPRAREWATKEVNAGLGLQVDPPAPPLRRSTRLRRALAAADVADFFFAGSLAGRATALGRWWRAIKEADPVARAARRSGVSA